PSHLEALRKSLEAMGARCPASTANLVSTYYDSKDLKLRRRHLTLRGREQDQKRVQTIKCEDPSNGSLLSRGEWEDVIAGDQPDLEAPESRSHLHDLVRRAELRPLFRTIVHRTIIELEPQSSVRIEAAIDEGEIRDPENGAVEPLSEIELEVKSGDPAIAYDVGLQLLDAAPLRIEMRSKAERGFRLIAADDAKPSAVRAEPIILDASMAVEAVLQTIGRRCMAHLLRD